LLYLHLLLRPAKWTDQLFGGYRFLFCEHSVEEQLQSGRKLILLGYFSCKD
jgi:hypothetical protein